MSGSERRRARASLRAPVIGLTLLSLATALPALAQEPPIALDTLWVVYERTSSLIPVTTRGVEILDREILARAPARTLGDVLTWALGTEVAARSSAHVESTIRGGTVQQVVILVDGVRVGDGPSGPHSPELDVPLDEVERVEILRGPASAALGGDGASGVINVVTRREAVNGITGFVEGGSFRSFNGGLSAGLGGPSAHFNILAEHRRSAGHRPGTDARSSQATVSARLVTGRRVLRGRASARVSDFGAAGFFAPYPEYDPKDHARAFEAGLAWEAPPDARIAIEPRVRFRYDRDDFLLQRNDPGYFRNLHDAWRGGGGLHLRYRHGSTFQVQGGVEFQRASMLSSNSGLPSDDGTCSVTFRCWLTEDWAAAYAEIGAGDVGQAALTAGIRGQWHSVYGFYGMPSISMAFWPADVMRVRAGIGVTQRVPSWTERFYVDSANVGDPNLLIERGRGIELGSDILPNANLRIAFTGFVRRMENMIDWIQPLPEPPAEQGPGDEEPGDEPPGDEQAGDEPPGDPPVEDPPGPGSPASARWYAANVHRATFDGLEVEVTAMDVLGARITFKALGVTYSSPELETIASRYAFRPLTRIVSLSVDRSIGEHVIVSARAFNGRRRGEPIYSRIDARLSVRAGGVSVYVDGVNLTDTEYLDITGLPAPRRALFVGASMNWTRGR